MNDIDQQYTPPYLSLNSSNDFHVNERAMTLIHGQGYITYRSVYSNFVDENVMRSVALCRKQIGQD
jgi:hypothetical protein